jgi:2-polyprenyl-6-methoxyphenol hydroxylase-like FAD-dependent oxidoreductase
MAAWSEAKTGYGYMRVKRAVLGEVLLQKITEEGPGIQVRWGKRVVEVQEDGNGAIVMFEDGTKDTADLVLGCDGIHSAIRTLFVDPEAIPQYSGISTISAFLSVKDLLDASTALTYTHATFTQDGLFGIGPCTADGDILFWFFSHEVAVPAKTYETDREGWEEHRRTEVEGFKTKLLGILKDVRGEWGSLLRSVVRQTEAVGFYPVFRLPLGRKWSRGRCLLLGDAAHAMQPHSGQGVSMALEDVFLLSRLLQTPSATLAGVSEKFNEIRRPRIEKFYKLAAKNGDERRKSNPWVLWFRELVIRVGLWVFTSLNLHRKAWWQSDLAYDIDEAEI